MYFKERTEAGSRRIVGTRWICKGDEENPEIRCRLVCQEVNTYQTEEFFAVTPPLETLHMILSIAAEKFTREVALVGISSLMHSPSARYMSNYHPRLAATRAS
jgi:hypothetical protein